MYEYYADMLRGFLILTVIASLVWCPIRCLAGATPSVSTDTERPTPRKCACCRHRVIDVEKPITKPSTPIQQSGDCDCPDCLCNGAVLGSGVFVDATVALAPLNVIATDSLGFDVISTFDGDLLNVPIRSAPSGREIVVLFGNLRR